LERIMLKALLPVDGSAAALRAVEYVIKLYGSCRNGQVVLVNVQPPNDSWEVKRFMKQAEIEAMQESRGGDALVSARQLLDAAQVPYEPQVLLGPVAETIVACAREKGCEQIIMGNKGESFLEEAVTGSIAHDVLRLSPLPVTYVK
jgi:nucleotide-binding universal stress UspA family protein